MFKRTKSIQRELRQANKRLKVASKALALKHKGGEWAEFNAAHKNVLKLERELAKSNNEQHATPSDFPIKWDVGAPLPYLFCNDYRAFLSFYINEPDPNWNGTNVNVVDPSSTDPASLCLVEFDSCISAKLGHPNDEAQGGHPLSGKGLEGYTAQIVENSNWLEEVAKTNSAHPSDNPEGWKEFSHYVFWFHDSTFECIAKSYSVEVTSESMLELLSRVNAKLLE